MSFNKSDFFHGGNVLKPRLNPQDRHERINRTFRSDRDTYFGKPEAPAAPPPPTIEDSDARRQDEADRIRMRRGRMASRTSDGSAPTTAAKYLLGA